MLGAIIGDAVGSAYEFQNTKDYNFKLFLSESNYTDDSVMTMAVAYWLLSDPAHTYQKLEDAMVLFAQNCPCPMGGYGTGFYYWLFRPSQLRSFDSRYGESPYRSKSGRHPYGSFGNGSAMRVSAVGWFFDTPAAAIWMARNGKTKEEIREYIENTYGYDLHKSWEYWHPIYHWESSCQGTVPQAIIAFLDSTDFEDAIRKAVSLGGDSDTLACITGGIAEAFYKDVPKVMADWALARFPQEFVEVLTFVREKTVYGKTCTISE